MCKSTQLPKKFAVFPALNSMLGPRHKSLRPDIHEEFQLSDKHKRRFRKLRLAHIETVMIDVENLHGEAVFAVKNCYSFFIDLSTGAKKIDLNADIVVATAFRLVIFLA